MAGAGRIRGTAVGRAHEAVPEAVRGLLAIDVSNTYTSLALWTAGSPDGAGPPPEPAPQHWQIASEPARTVDEHRLVLTQLLASRGLAPPDVAACVIGCVVPELRATVVAACRECFRVDPLVVGPGVRSGLRIRTESPRELGADRIANAVAAVARFGSPVIVLDFSTAVTLDVIGAGGDYLGAIIAPGIDVAAAALAQRTARLRHFDISPPTRAIAEDTEAAVRSGVFFGLVGLIEGLVARVRAEIGPAAVVATGEAPWLPAVVDHTTVIDAYAPLLTLDGLRRIYVRHAVAGPAGG